MKGEFWKRFIDEVSENYPLFFTGYNVDNRRWFTDKEWDDWEREDCEVHEQYGVDVYYGQDKVCFISTYDDDYVLKMSRNSDEMCRDEVYIYSEAVKAGVDEYFAECIYFAENNGIDFYLMERADADEDRVNENSDHWEEYYAIREEDEEEAQRVYEELEDSEDCETVSMECFERIYCARENFGKFLSFLEEYNVNDIHKANCGWKGDLLKLIDYSGYCVERPFLHY